MPGASSGPSAPRTHSLSVPDAACGRPSTTVVIRVEYLHEGAWRCVMTAITAWAEDFAALLAQIGPRFARSEARRHAADYLHGLLSHTVRKNGWQLAETVGDATPYGIQQFLYRAAWDPD